jgi:hypothetical protein
MPCWYMVFEILVSNVCSVAREPKLDEWVARATLYDTLQDEVGFHLTFMIVKSFWNLYVVPFIFYCRFRSELLWWESTPV